MYRYRPGLVEVAMMDTITYNFAQAEIDKQPVSPLLSISFDLVLYLLKYQLMDK